MKARNKKIPVTVITGFLGSGKTTLVNRILTENHGIRFAIIENEFGEIGIDQELVLNEKEEIIEMNNGCICCTVRGDLIRIVKKLVNDINPPDHILIETTGLADPAPVAQTFLTDPEIADKTFLDSIITLVDVKHIEGQLIASHESKDQIAFADIILLSKTDIVSEEDISKVQNKIMEINRFAKIISKDNDQIDIKELFNVGGFDVDRALTINPKFMEIEYPFEYAGIYDLDEGIYTINASPNEDETEMKMIFAGTPETTDENNIAEIANVGALLFSAPTKIMKNNENIIIGNDLNLLKIENIDTKFIVNINIKGSYIIFTEHMPHEFNLNIKDSNGDVFKPVIAKEFRGSHSHDSEVTSVGIETDIDLDGHAFLYYINTLIQTFGVELYRYKGIISVSGESNRVVLQGVHMLFEMKSGKEWKDTEKRKSSIIFIGKDLNRNILTQGFVSCQKI